MVRIFGTPGRSRRLRVGIGLTACTVLVALIAIPALAVHDETFQLDGDVIASTTTNVGGTTQTVDWDTLITAAGIPVASLPTGFTAASFDRDFNTNANGSFNTSDASTFATGSKDTLPITPGWQCNRDANVNSKIDVMNGYAATYEAPNGDEILYFALERNANTGDANVGFWFLQDPTVGCESPGGSTPFTGDHTDGDLLIVSEFSNGGLVSTINVYRWDGGADGSLNPNAVASGVDCKTTAGDDTACGTANTGTITTPWLTSNKQDGPGHSLRVAEFFEGGLNLTAAELGGKCFNTFMADTRSSTSLTATLFDFSLGQLGACTSDVTTTPRDSGGNTIPVGGLSIGTGSVNVFDRAVIDVTGVEDFGGEVTFHLCGPLALNTTSNCQTGGAEISTETVTGTNNTATVNSDTVTLTSVGRYCWRAEYSGDDTAGVPGSSDPDDSTNTSECFKVNPVTPTLATQASNDVLLGNPISDTATLTGTANQPGTGGLGGAETIAPGSINPTSPGAAAGGNITFTAFGPNDCTTVAMASTNRAVSGDGTYPTAAQTAVSFTPTAVGTYTFVASYNGSSPNTNAVPASACPDPSGAEDVIVSGAASLSTAQNWLPNDTAHITSPAGTTLAGTVTFTLFNDGACGTAGGTSQFNQSRNVVTDAEAGGTANNRTVKTTNTAFFVTAANDAVAWSWKVSYNDTGLADPADVCETTTPAFTLTDS